MEGHFTGHKYLAQIKDRNTPVLAQRREDALLALLQEQASLFYPFIPVNVMPSINVRWAKKKANRIGRVTIVLTAIR